MLFFRQFLITGAATFIVVFVSFFNNIIVTRQLGPELRGKYTVIITLVMLLSLLFGEGIRKTSTILSGDQKENIKGVITLNFITASVILIVLISLGYFAPGWEIVVPGIDQPLILISMFIITFQILWLSFQAILLGKRDVGQYNLIQIIQTVTYFIVNLTGIYFFNFGLYEIILSMLASTVIASFSGIILLKINISQISLNSLSRLKGVFSLVFKSTFSGAFLFIIFRGDIFLVNYFLGSKQAGYYSIAVIFSEILQRLPNIVGPLLLSKTLNENKAAAIEGTVRLSRVLLFFNLVVVIFLFFFGEFIIGLLFGNAFLPSFRALLYLLPALLFFSPGSMIYSFFMGQYFPRIILWINGVIGLINFFLNILLIPKYGIIAAALVSSVTYALWMLAYSVYLSFYGKIRLSEMIFIRISDFNYLIKGTRSLAVRRK